MSIPSVADPAASDAVVSPDFSLAERAPVEHRGLIYPFGRSGPEAGTLIGLADGIGWTRLPVPGALNHINIWVLEDEGGVALVNTGLDIPPSRAAWEALFAGALAGQRARVFRAL